MKDAVAWRSGLRAQSVKPTPGEANSTFVPTIAIITPGPDRTPALSRNLGLVGVAGDTNETKIYQGRAGAAEIADRLSPGRENRSHPTAAPLPGRAQTRRR